ncbi:superoxide dismutase family protein [Paenibacillus montanisoli]|uniref:Superoxide dismutase [Cu-Zn] n=1 Tax=Paenibacillus montanisoli TaxID=2081970 RepID=A0A328U8G2_9BACL|nr:superoxide dismutase family protein [Paenibacillus montanisoli]RAP78362.1 superoxide dismutase [Paenibacillus montanisoli]
MRKFVLRTGRTALCFAFLAAAIGGTAGAHPMPEAKPVQVKLMNTSGADVGFATLTQKGDAVVLHVEAKNLPPGVHGIHFHETGKCEVPDFKSSGAHLNPQTKQHGFNNPKGFHVGDLPNITVAADGTVKVDIESRIVTLAPNQPNSLLKSGGTALVIHAQADDYVTDPAGNSGDRIACGVIGQ